MQHDIADGLRGIPLAYEAETPREDARNEYRRHQSSNRRGGMRLRQDVDAMREQERQDGVGQRPQHDHHRHQQHHARAGTEVADDARDQLAVRVRSVVGLGVQPIHDEAHIVILRVVCGCLLSMMARCCYINFAA